MNLDEKECPYCAEIIKAKATKCRHCGSDLSQTFTPNLKVNREDVSNFQLQESRKSYTGWIILAFVAVILTFTNPTEKDFKYEIVKKIQESGKVDDSNPFEKLIVGFASYAIDSATERKDYLIFSIFEIDTSILKIINPDTPRLKFLGIGGQIIPIYLNVNETLSSLEKIPEIFNNFLTNNKVIESIKDNQTSDVSNGIANDSNVDNGELDDAYLQSYKGKYSSDCNNSESPFIRITKSAIVIKVDGQIHRANYQSTRVDIYGRTEPPIDPIEIEIVGNIKNKFLPIEIHEGVPYFV